MMNFRTEQEPVRDTVSILKSTLDMLAKDFDSMSSAEVRELVWLAKYEVDRIIGALGPSGNDRRLTLAARS